MVWVLCVKLLISLIAFSTTIFNNDTARGLSICRTNSRRAVSIGAAVEACGVFERALATTYKVVISSSKAARAGLKHDFHTWDTLSLNDISRTERIFSLLDTLEIVSLNFAIRRVQCHL